MKVFHSTCGDKLVRTDTRTSRDGFRAVAAVPPFEKILLICEEHEEHTRILLSKENLKQLKKQLRAAEKELGWKT